MTTNSATRIIEINKATMGNVWTNFVMDVELLEAERKTPLTLGNTHYSSLIEKTSLEDKDKKRELNIRIIFCVS